MRNHNDSFAKKLVRAALEAGGAHTPEAEVSPDAQRFDNYFIPSPRRGSARDLFERLTGRPSALEHFSSAPAADVLVECVRKLLNARHVFPREKPPKPAPFLWTLCAGDPERGRMHIGATSRRGYPRGVYIAVPGLHTGVVALNQLPETRDTLILRLMATGATRERALAELARLPPGARERRAVMPIVLQCRVAIPKKPEPTRDDKEFLMQTENIVKQMQSEWERKGKHEARQAALFDIYRARFGAVPRKVRAAVERTQDDALLARWTELFATRSADEIAATLAPAKR